MERRRGWSEVLLVCALFLGLPVGALAWPPSVSEALSFKARAHFLIGEAVQLDLQRRRLVIKPEGETKEMAIAVDASTRITSGGRVIRLEDLRAGDRLAISCSDAHEGEHLARLVAVRGPARRTPSPAPPATPKP